MRTMTICLLLAVWITAAPARVAAQEPIETAPEWDPLRANKDMEVGTFYMKKGNYDAAIERFEDAARVQPGLARPYLLLGQTHEKLKDFPKAVESYRKYLELYKTAPDGKKVRKHIEELEQRIARESGRSGAGQSETTSKPGG